MTEIPLPMQEGVLCHLNAMGVAPPVLLHSSFDDKVRIEESWALYVLLECGA
jgi:hypothetical protein